VPQHFAIVLDDDLESFPLIDYRKYPDGIASRFVQIARLKNMREAREIALVLQTGALPVHFVRVR
jgi:preprotein translocase subunit SecD